MHAHVAPIYRVRTVPTVQEACETLVAQAPHVVVSASTLPDGVGEDVASVARRQTPARRPGVIVLSPSDRPPFPEAVAVVLAAAIRLQPSAATLPDADTVGRRLVAVTHGRLGDPDFGTAPLAAALGLSLRQLRQRLAAASGEAPGDPDRRIWMERADGLRNAGAGVEESGSAGGFRISSPCRAVLAGHVRDAPTACVDAQPERSAASALSEIKCLPSEPDRSSGGSAQG